MKTRNKNLVTLCAAIFALLILPASGLAHDKSMHKGKPTEGEITMVSADSFEMKTAKKVITVLIVDKTEFEMGDAAASKSDLMTGMKVKVFGTKMPGGKMAAKEILLEKHKGHDGDDHKHNH